MPGLDAVIALHAALCGNESSRSQRVPVERDHLLAEVAPILDLSLQHRPGTHTCQALSVKNVCLAGTDLEGGNGAHLPDLGKLDIPRQLTQWNDTPAK